jgi:hypothetical protein
MSRGRTLGGAELPAVEPLLRSSDPFRGLRVSGFDWYSVWDSHGECST